ncbi:MAG: L-threonine 3-dehydrogenase [Holophagaceae bacterium]|nr:L-threonine 3-dehydrogenase [Holophagaceae bacterium]
MTKTMRALVKAERTPGLTMQEVSVPEIGPNDVLIRIHKTAICGTDMHIWNWDNWSQKTIPVPMHVGHEYVGIIERVGSAVKGYKGGERVTGEGHIVCGHCRNCRAGKRHLCPNTVGVGVNRPGAFADYLSLPAENVFPVPDSIPDDIVSVFDPFGNAAHTALSYNLVGEDVLITGAGPIGIMAVAICKHAGARHVVITDVNDYRLGLAKKMGATAAVNIAKQDIKDVEKNLGMTEGFDVGLEMSGNPGAFRSMIESMSNGGRIALLGLLEDGAGVDWGTVIFKGLFLKGIYGREMYETWYKMAAMLQSGLDISQIITHRFPIKDFKSGFEVMGSGQSGKVVLDWGQ